MNKEIQSLLDDRNKCWEKVRSKDFENCASDMNQLVKACGRLFDERKKHIKPALEKYGKNLFRVKITKGKWQGTNSQGEISGHQGAGFL